MPNRILKKINIKFLLLLISLLGLISYSALNYIIGKEEFNDIKKMIDINPRYKEKVKKIFFPYNYIHQQKELIKKQEAQLSQLAHESRQTSFINYFPRNALMLAEIEIKNNNEDIDLKKILDLKLSNNQILRKYAISQGFWVGIAYKFPGSGFIDFYEDNLIVLSSRGILAFSKNIDKNLSLKQIKNNAYDFGFNPFKDEKWFSFKDLHIYKNKIFLSFAEQIKKDCWNISVLEGNMNYKKINFKKLYSPNECVNALNNFDNEFHPHQSGGRIVQYDNNHILLSLGSFRLRYLAQDKSSVNGKIIKINIYNGKYEIISMGHRNPQGLFYDKKNNFLLETEHGPEGGDEVNLIDLKNIEGINIPNFGWAISSYGEHYGGRIPENEEKYKKYPLYKSHRKYGFVEPIKYFVPSIGISQIFKISENKYVFGSMRDKSLYFFSLNKKREMENLKRIEIKERIRDLYFKNNRLYLFLEDTASIGIINFN